MENDILTDPDEVRADSNTKEDDIVEEPHIIVGGEPILPGPEVSTLIRISQVLYG